MFVINNCFMFIVVGYCYLLLYRIVHALETGPLHLLETNFYYYSS